MLPGVSINNFVPSAMHLAAYIMPFCPMLMPACFAAAQWCSGVPLHMVAALMVMRGTVWLTSDASVPMEIGTGASSSGSSPSK